MPIDESRSEESLRHEREAIELADRIAGDSKLTKYARVGGLVAGRAVGALLIVTGVSKALAPAAFGQQIAAYEIVEHPAVVGMLAYAIIVAECALGGALIANFKPRLMLALAFVLMLAFLGVVGYAWQTGSVADCGCLPWMTRTPKEAFFEDLALLGLIAWAAWANWNGRAGEGPVKLAIVTVALAVGLILPGVMGPAGPKPGAAGVVGSSVFQKMKVDESQVVLSSGDHLVLLMSTECAHCQEAVPKVNELASDARLPKLIAIASEDKVSRGLFREDYKASFPIAQISTVDRDSLLTDKFPRLFLVRDGLIVAVWDGSIPTAEEIVSQK